MIGGNKEKQFCVVISHQLTNISTTNIITLDNSHMTFYYHKYSYFELVVEGVAPSTLFLFATLDLMMLMTMKDPESTRKNK